MVKSLSIQSTSSNFNHGALPGGSSALWVRIASFLSGRAPLTRVTYGGILTEWCRFLGAEFGSERAAELIVSASDLHASSYRVWLEQQRGQKSRYSTRQDNATGSAPLPTTDRRKRASLDGAQETLSNATIAKKLSALRRIYKALIASGLINGRNPFDVDQVRPPSARSGMKRPTKMIEFQLVKEILALPDRTLPKGVRDYALLSLLFGGGLRRGEIQKIRIGDIKRSPAGTVYVTLRATKARRDVDHALPSWCADALLELVRQRRRENASEGDPLFVGYRGQAGTVPSHQAISASGIYLLFKGYCARVGGGSDVSPHSARATAITKLLADGFSHREVQEFSRHASVQMVETYDKRRLSIEDSPGRKLSFLDE